jgi:hypothetical protein
MRAVEADQEVTQGENEEEGAQNPDYEQAGVKEALAVKEHQKQLAEASGETEKAKEIQDEIDQQKKEIDESGTPGDQASTWIEVGIAVASAFLPDPVGDAVTGAVAGKAGAITSGIVRKIIGKYGDEAVEEALDGLNLTKHIPRGTNKIDNVAKGAAAHYADDAMRTAREVGVDIPEGWVAERTRKDTGWIYRKPGTEGNEGIVRIMEPTDRYPEGYVVYYSKTGQPLSPTGAQGSRSNWHRPIGDHDPPPGWPGN